ncbi:glycosyltransferase family protein [Fortiea contorta]|uniref:glycosyltransferase family protein n=1 Tax=Fortiea contorta TaxID=1892405 RepID=UPI00034495B6|nr:glycosyltransferase [Fortiea contorta]
MGNKQKIIYVQYTNPAGYPPLEHSSHIFAKKGWEVLFMGTDVFGLSALCLPCNSDITVQLMPSCPAGWRQKLHYLQFGFWVLFSTLIWQPQWVYASDLLSCPVAVILSFLPNINVVYHEHDSHNSTANSLFIQLCLTARKWLAKRAKICILPNQERVKKFALDTSTQHKLFCVWNCPAQAEANLERPFFERSGLQILYHGSIVPSRLPVTVLQALALLPNTVKLRIIGYDTLSYLNYMQHLKEIADQIGVSNQVEFVAAMPRYELLKWCRECDVGLAFMPTDSNDMNMQYMVGASNKPFDYLACGLALLVSDIPEWKQMYVEPGYGFACNPLDPESIATNLAWYLSHPMEMKAMGDRGRKRILDEWNYEQQFIKIIDKLSDF